MTSQIKWKDQIQAFDERRDIVIPGNKMQTINFCVQQFIDIAQHAIKDHGSFSVALSGGSTPKSIYEQLTTGENREKIDWKKVYLFWSDERAVPPDNIESNYRMAMEAGFSKVPIPAENVFRMVVENHIDEHAKEYEKLIKSKVHSGQFDLVMLGMGEDGHTASLFPKSHGLHTPDRYVVANYVQQMHVWRMTMTYECINAAKHISIYVLGKNKAEMVKRVLSGPFDPDELPIQNVGTPTHKALWILDSEAASQISK